MVFMPGCRILTLTSLITGCLIPHVAAQELPQFFSNPPTSFSAEDATFPNAIPLPECARLLLAHDRETAGPLEYENLPPEQLPRDWFTASEQPMKQGNETLLVVMGAKMMRGANVNPFWIFLRSGESCETVLKVGAHDIDALKTRTNGLPDIKIVAMTAVSVGESWYKFDGKTYQLARTLRQPIGAEVPKDLSGFEARISLVQRPEQDPESILAQARGWLWQQWWLEKPSYLKVKLHSKEGDETVTTYYIEKGSGQQMLVTIQIHSVLTDRGPHQGTRNTITRDELIFADDVERRWAIAGNSDRTQQVPENDEVAPDSYELFFHNPDGFQPYVL